MLASTPTIKPATNRKTHNFYIIFSILEKQTNKQADYIRLITATNLSKEKRWLQEDNRICDGEGHDLERKKEQAS